MKQQKHTLEDEGYDLYIVKRNDGKEVRLASFWSILRYIKTGNQDRTEISLEVTEEESKNELLQKNQIIWWKLSSPIFHEATREDQRAESEYQEVLKVIDSLPDIDPIEGSVGTLVKMFHDKTYKIVDGASRRIQ